MISEGSSDTAAIATENSALNSSNMSVTFFCNNITVFAVFMIK